MKGLRPLSLVSAGLAAGACAFDADPGSGDALETGTVFQAQSAHLPCTSNDWGKGRKANGNPKFCSFIWYEDLPPDTPDWLCSSSAGGDPLVDCEAGKVERTAVVYPGDGSVANPRLVFYFHGSSEGDWVADAQGPGGDGPALHNAMRGAIVVYGEATSLTNHDGTPREFGEHDNPSDRCWSPRFPYQENTTFHSDVPYFDKLLDLIPHDPARVYAAGYSSGAHFALTLSELRRDVFRGVAAMGAATYVKEEKKLDTPAVVASGQQHPSLPILYIMGVHDSTIESTLFVDGPNSYVHHTVRQLTARNGASTPRQDDSSVIDDLRHAVDGAGEADFAEHVFPAAKPNGAPLRLIIHKGGHGWANQGSFLPTEVVGDFFRDLPPLTLEENPYFNHGWMTPVLVNHAILVGGL